MDSYGVGDVESGCVDINIQWHSQFAQSYTVHAIDLCK